jgi:hypothetical protein
MIQKEKEGIVPKSVKVQDVYNIVIDDSGWGSYSPNNAPNSEPSDPDIVMSTRWR